MLPISQLMRCITAINCCNCKGCIYYHFNVIRGTVTIFRALWTQPLIQSHVANRLQLHSTSERHLTALCHCRFEFSTSLRERALYDHAEFPEFRKTYTPVPVLPEKSWRKIKSLGHLSISCFVFWSVCLLA